MGATSRYGWLYPELFDPPNTALHLKDLAEDIEATVGALDDKMSADIGLEVRANVSQPVANASGANKLTFGLIGKSPNGVLWTGNNTVTIQESGRYSLYAAASTTFAAGNNFGVGIHGTSAPAAGTPWLASPLFSTGQTDSFAAVTRYFIAGTQLCAYVYNNGSAITLNPATNKPAEFIVWKA